jgi:hypothetical protein
MVGQSPGMTAALTQKDNFRNDHEIKRNGALGTAPGYQSREWESCEEDRDRGDRVGNVNDCSGEV